MKPLLIVFEGSDQSGKTKAVRYCKEYFGDKAEFAEEAATLLGGPFSHDGSEEGIKKFQQNVYQKQVVLEREAIERAEANGKPLVICDRGFPDGSAFYPGGLDAYVRDNNIDLDAARSRYACVLLLDPVAVGGLDSTNKSNAVRKLQSKEAIMAQHDRIRLAYAGHPNIIEIPFTETFDEKWELIRKVILEYVE